MGNLRSATKWYIAALVFTALGVLAWTLTQTTFPPSDRLVVIAVVLALAVIASSFPLGVASGMKLSLHTSVVFAATLLFEPAIAMLMAGGAWFIAHIPRRRPPDEIMFNAAHLMLQVGVGGSLLAWGGWDFNRFMLGQPAFVPLIAIAAIVMTLIELGAVAVVVALESRQSPHDVLRQLAPFNQIELIAQYALGLLGALLADAYPWALPLVIPPFVVLYRSSQRQVQLQQQAQALEHQAFHDSLTNLPNRALFLDRLQHALDRGARTRRTLAVLFLDLDRFKHINDSLGHDAGDQLLIAVAKRLAACVRPEDTVARLGGDEFTVLLEDIQDVYHATNVAERIQRVLQTPFPIASQEVIVSASIGITLSEAGQHTPSDVLRNADAAMYKAKEKGKACYEVSSATTPSRTLTRLQLETDLYQAIERNEFEVHYQPLVDLGTGKIVCFEALVRWAHPRRGLLSPAQFIPLAEETGLILQLGRLVLHAACRQARLWLAQRPHGEQFAISVNLSARQFQHPALAEDVRRALVESGLQPYHLRLEITESVLMDQLSSAMTTLQSLKHLGVRLAIDDFGTGYSSLSYLKHFPIDTLKIDKSFVDRLSYDLADAAIVQAIVTLAHTLKMQIVAEGVETAEQLRVLQRLGCELGQGYLFAQPLPGEVAGALLFNDSQLRMTRIATSA